MYLYCHMFSALRDHSKYCTNIIYYLVVSYIHPLLLKLFAHKSVVMGALPQELRVQWLRSGCLLSIVRQVEELAEIFIILCNADVVCVGVTVLIS